MQFIQSQNREQLARFILVKIAYVNLKSGSISSPTNPRLQWGLVKYAFIKQKKYRTQLVIVYSSFIYIFKGVRDSSNYQLIYVYY